MCGQNHKCNVAQSTGTGGLRASDPLDNYHWSVTLLENTAWWGVFGLGSAVLWTIHPLIAVAYLTYSLSCMYLLFPYLVCTSCSYYGHTCHSGQGRIQLAAVDPGRPIGRRERDCARYQRKRALSSAHFMVSAWPLA